MLTAILAAGVFRYQLAAGVVRTYDFSATFEGLIPILGGQEGKAEVKLALEVTGLKPDREGTLRAQPKITAAEISFNGGKIPLSLETIAGCFPASPVEFTPLGVTSPLASPKPAPPFRLPGLDVNRLAELVFLPLEFPAEESAQWSFTRMIGGAKVESLVQPEGEQLMVEQTQQFTVQENEALEIVTDPKEAVSRVATQATTKGWVKFDQSRGHVTASELRSTSRSTVTDIESGKQTSRELKSVMKCSLRRGES